MAAKKTRTSAKKKAATTKKSGATQAKKTDTQNKSNAKTKKSPAAAVEMKPSHDQIARRAEEIWIANGRPAGQDEANWLAAEAELTAQLNG